MWGTSTWSGSRGGCLRKSSIFFARFLLFFSAGDFHRSARRLRKSISVVFQDSCSAHGWVQINSRNVELLKEWLCCVKDERTRPCCGVPSWTTSWLDTWQKSVPIFMIKVDFTHFFACQIQKKQILVLKDLWIGLNLLHYVFRLIIIASFCQLFAVGWPYPNTHHRVSQHVFMVFFKARRLGPHDKMLSGQLS